MKSLPPIQADPGRLFKITVCTRPFRAQGPRVEAERVGDKVVVHNYGHGGSGWSLSWGSGALALDLALHGRDPSTTDIAVIGCGALGLTAASLAQRAGCRSVTIYARDRPSETRSFRATGAFTPDSRIALTHSMPPGFPARWEQMTRTSWRVYQSLLDQPGSPIALTDRYYLSNPHPDLYEQQLREQDPLHFAWLTPRIQDILPARQDLPPRTHPFPTQWARRRTELVFDITAYTHHLSETFQSAGGRFVTREFHIPADFATLPQPVILHCTGYAARALFSDNTLTPVRGQIGWLPPQPEIDYGILYEDLIINPRPDGIVVQSNPKADLTGWNDPDETPDHAEAERNVRKLQALCAGIHSTTTATPGISSQQS